MATIELRRPTDLLAPEVEGDWDLLCVEAGDD